MTSGILSKLINEIGEAHAEARAESYAMVNVRPGEKVAVMLDILSKLSGKSPSALVADEVSRRLADYAAASSANAEAILEAVEKATEQLVCVFAHVSLLGYRGVVNNAHKGFLGLGS